MDERFTATLEKSPSKGGWTYLVCPESVRFFGTRGLVKVVGQLSLNATDPENFLFTIRKAKVAEAD